MDEIYTYHGTKGTIRITDAGLLGEHEFVIDISICSTKPDNISLSVYHENGANQEGEILRKYNRYGFAESEFNGISGDPVVLIEGNLEALKKRQPEGLVEKLEILKAEVAKNLDKDKPVKYAKPESTGSIWGHISNGSSATIVR